MRILSLGFPLPGAPIDNHDFASAPSFFDYAAIVVDPHAVSELIEEGVAGGSAPRTHDGVRDVNGATAPGAVCLASGWNCRP